MNAKAYRATLFGLLLLGMFALGACGTLQIEYEPGAAAAEQGDSTTSLSQATPFPPTVPAPVGATDVITRIVTRVSTQREPEIVAVATAEPPGDASAQEVVTDSEIISLDETWNQYSDFRLGFSIRFPKTMVAFFGSCTWNEEQGSYRPEMALVPVKIFEDSDAIYIAPETYYELAGERTVTTTDGGTRYFYDQCNQMANSLELLRDPGEPLRAGQLWKLVVAEIHDDGELEGFLKARYGSGCSLGEKVASKHRTGSTMSKSWATVRVWKRRSACSTLEPSSSTIPKGTR